MQESLMQESNGSRIRAAAGAGAEEFSLSPPPSIRVKCATGLRLSFVDGSDNRLGKFLFQIIEATRGGMPARDGNRSPRDDRSWGSRAKDFVICAEAALRGKKGDPYPLNNSTCSLGRWVG